jgi:hypothetical protein
MSRRKKSVSHYEKAITRLASLHSIDPKLDLGNGLSNLVYESAIKELRAKLDDYNTTLSLVDEKQNQVEAAEKELLELSERMLIGIAAKYGKNSNEYEKAGGTKKSERRRRIKKADQQKV